MGPPVATDVISWDDAMQQVGDDEEFLRELLGDLRSEAEQQLSQIAATIQNPTDATPFHRIMRAAHVIKGAAANLMCGPLRQSAMMLENAARAAHEQGEMSSPADVRAAVQNAHAQLQAAATNYVAFVQSIGV